MQRRIRLTQNLLVGTDQPSEADLQGFAAEGIKSVVDLRRDGEPNQALPPVAEGQAARRFGLAYKHIPVGTDWIDEDTLDLVHNELARLPEPIYVHCGSGKRSGLLALVHRAINEGLTGNAMTARAEELGVAFGSPELRDFLRRYVDKRQSARRSVPAH
ncbi:MAG TPA: sulfur transferase domain-containing protein [Alphaproteobacteria bacterium]|nr:sulfur transferase domain-containing protein [Alphaproteobacteria bacterium]